MKRILLLLSLAVVVHGSEPAALDVAVNGRHVVDQLLHLANFSDDLNPAVTRILFTKNDVEARKYIKSLMEEEGLAIREDTMGNIFGRWEGAEAGAATVMTGSHCDAIPLAGAYDGTLGVVGGIAAVKALKKAGFTPKRPIDVLMFTSEEPTRFGIGCIGSRGMAGVLDAATLDSKLDANGTNFQAAAAEAGYGAASHQAILDGARMRPGAVAAFVELHIEQGARLEAAGTDLGIVSAIAAPAALRVEFSGDGGHAGALLMPDRHDAALAGAELALAVEAAALGTGARDTVATTGVLALSPGTVNSVPRNARLEIDVRDIDGDRRDGVVESIIATARRIAAARSVRHSVEVINADPPATCSTEVMGAAEAAAAHIGASHTRMVSRAYHDALFMAQLAPTGMIFIPCRGGWSHRPDEYASPEAIATGVRALALTLASLAGDARAAPFPAVSKVAPPSEAARATGDGGAVAASLCAADVLPIEAPSMSLGGIDAEDTARDEL